MIGYESSAAIVALLVVPLIYKNYYRGVSLSNIPLVGGDGVGGIAHYVSGAKGIIAQGYQKVSRSPSIHEGIPVLICDKLQKGLGIFRLWTPDGYICVPSQNHLVELKNLGDDQLDEVAPSDRVSERSLFVELSTR